MVNQGQIKYETVSERLGAQAAEIILEKLGGFRNGGAASATETEKMTLLAGALMMIQYKVSSAQGRQSISQDLIVGRYAGAMFGDLTCM
jgi:hypothetical protein